MAEPKRAGHTRSLRSLDRILASKGIHVVPEDAESLDGHPAEENPGDQEWHHRARADYALNRWSSGTPPRFRDSEASMAEVTAWADLAASDNHGAGGLLLTGHTGTGKTHQAYGALRRIAESGPERFEMIAVNSADMYGSLRPSQVMGSAEHELRRLSEVQYLFIDDIGTAKTSEWTEEITYRIFNSRYNHCLPTIITSNLPARDENGPDLSDFVGARVASRLAEMVTTLVPMIGDDRRRGGGRAA